MATNQGSWFQLADHDAVDDRRVLEGIMAQGGVGDTDELSATTAAGLNVSIGAGHVFVPGSLAGGPGFWHGYNDGPVTVPITAPAATARRDLIVAEFLDEEALGVPPNEWRLRSVDGSTGAYPNAPAVPDNCIPLWEVDVQNGDTTFTSGDFTDRRTLYAPRRGVIPVLSTARPSSPSNGTMIYETNTKKVLVYQGSVIGWERLWNLSWGELGSDAISNNETGVGTTVTDITGLSVAIDIPAGRKIRVDWDLHVAASIGGESCRVFLREGGSTIQTWECTDLPVFGVYRAHSGFSRINNPSAGAHTYKMSIRRSSGSGTVNAGAGSEVDGVGRMLVTDLGPV